MIDGVKIDVPNLNGAKWLNNSLLDFHTYTNTSTGELINDTLTAQYKGLRFVITTSKKYEGLHYCSVRGSLHRYFNKGKDNANDFTFNQLQTVINDLENTFCIDPKQAVLGNLEFGVNIATPQTAKSIIYNLVAYNDTPFKSFKIDGLEIGKGLGKHQYKVKAYDKSKQLNRKDKNILRFELSVNKMQYLKSYNITMLSDLQDIKKLTRLGGLLLQFWNNAIYYDKQVNWRAMTDFERKKLLYYATPRNWGDFDTKQRYRAKKHFNDLIALYGTTSTHLETGALLAKKWNELTAVKCLRFYHDLEVKRQPLNVHDFTVRMHGKNIDKTTPKNINLKTSKKMIEIDHQNQCTKTVRFCRSCKTDISNKKVNSLYCSKKCNNSYHALQRKKKRHEIKKVENDILESLTLDLPCSNFLLLVKYKTITGVYADRLYQMEINALPAFIRKVTRVEIWRHQRTIILTSNRAKKFVRIVNNINKKRSTYNFKQSKRGY